MKLRLSAFIALAFLLLSVNNMMAQGCTPNTSNTVIGYTPNPGIPVTQGVYYGQVQQLYVPLTYSSVTVDSINFASLSGLPTGISYTFNPASQTIAGGGNGCVWLYGLTTDTAGTYTIAWSGNVYTSLGTFPLSNFASQFSTTLSVLPHTTPGVYLDSNQTVCSNSTIIMHPVIIGGTPPYTYYWMSNGNQLSCNTCSNPSVTITQNSTYILAVTDVNALVFVDTVTYTVNGTSNNVQLNFANTGLTCTSGIDTTTLSIVNGTGPYKIDWGNATTQSGQTSPAIFNYLSSGTYIIHVTDARGCITSAYDTVPNTGINIDFSSVVQPNCPQQNTGSITAFATGGTPSYNYIWNNGGFNATINNLPAGSYQVTVTDGMGCSAVQAYYLISLSDPWDYYVYLQPTDANCGSTGGVSATAYGGIAPYSYNWSNGATSLNNTGLASGTYTVTVTDSAGCRLSASTNVNSACVSIITGVIYNDINNNCVQDIADSGIEYVYVMATAGNGNNYYGITDGNGLYNIQVSDTGIFQLTTPNWGAGGCGNYTFCGNPNQTIYLPALGDSSGNNNIAFTASSGFNLGIHPGWTSANPGFTKQYWIYYYDSSPTPYNGTATITFTYDPNLTYQYSDSTAPLIVNTNAHTLTWQVPTSPITYLGSYVNAFFSVPATLNLNTLLQSDFRIDPTSGDCDSSDNKYHFTESVTGSHDPNEKDVIPANTIATDDSILTYTIHFQNNGSDSTHFIIVADTLSAYLDPASVRNIASSYKYSAFNVSGRGILKWIFNPYRLPDSSTNAAASKGFITFTVQKKRNLPAGTIISNTAYIYFDYNPAVVTNTVSDTVVNPLGIIAVADNQNNVTVRAYPNPFKDYTNIVVSGIDGSYNFKLYDITGRLVQTISSINTDRFQVQSHDMPEGMYMFRISAGNHQLYYGKLVIQ